MNGTRHYGPDNQEGLATPNSRGHVGQPIAPDLDPLLINMGFEYFSSKTRQRYTRFDPNSNEARCRTGTLNFGDLGGLDSYLRAKLLLKPL